MMVRSGSPICISFPPRLHSGSGHAGNRRVLGGGSPREELLADGAPAHALADDDEHLADLVYAWGARAPLCFLAAVISIGNSLERFEAAGIPTPL